MSAERIRELNDALRNDLFNGDKGRVLVTTAVDQLSPLDRARLLEQVRTFDAFCADNDPHSEHDFGSIEFLGRTWWFKIDYFDLDMKCGSSDPADPAVTTRGHDDRRNLRILMPWYRKHHTCECGAEWWDEWSCLCNDECPECGLKDIEPDEFEEVRVE